MNNKEYKLNLDLLLQMLPENDIKECISKSYLKAICNKANIINKVIKKEGKKEK